MAFAYQIQEMTAETGVAEFVERFVWVERFLPACRQCHNYEKRWTCPSFAFDPMDIWGAYRTLRLYARVLRGEGGGQPLEEAIAALKREKEIYRRTLYQWEQETPGSQMLSAGTCELCDMCQRERGEACPFPERMRYSIEALGGDVEGCVRHYFHMHVLWGKDGLAPEYLVLVGGLLMK